MRVGLPATGSEFCYDVHGSPWLASRQNPHDIRHPGGRDDQHNAMVIARSQRRDFYHPKATK
jgi:carbohydrate-selective porin OprB